MLKITIISLILLLSTLILSLGWLTQKTLKEGKEAIKDIRKESSKKFLK